MGSATRAPGATGTAGRPGPGRTRNPGADASRTRAARTAPPVPASTSLRTESRTSRVGPFQVQQLVLLELAAAVLLVAAAVVFFAYSGFEAVANLGEEAKNPGRDMPRGLIGTLVVCTVLYLAVCLVLTGMVD